MGSAFIKLLGDLIRRGGMVLTSKQVAVGAGGAAAIQLGTDLLTGQSGLDFFRAQALRLAPGSDANALEEVARLAMRLLNLDSGQVFWPRDRISGDPIPPMYMVLDFNRGRAWFTGRNPASRRRSFGGRGRYLRTARRYARRYAR